jgi:hypothetical protein
MKLEVPEMKAVPGRIQPEPERIEPEAPDFDPLVESRQVA